MLHVVCTQVESRNKDVKQLQELLAASHHEAADYTASIENMQVGTIPDSISKLWHACATPCQVA